jgi:hypothetical protein
VTNIPPAVLAKDYRATPLVSESADVIDANGRVRYVLNTDPGPGSEASKSSFSVRLADAIRSAIRAS